MERTTICLVSIFYSDDIRRIEKILKKAKTTAITNSKNGVVRIWEGRTSFKGDYFDGHVDSCGEDLLVHIDADSLRHRATEDIIRMLSAEGKKTEMRQVNGVEIYTVV